MRGPSSRVRKNLAKGVLPLGILASAGLVWQSSYAAFSGTTSDAGSSWTAGTVSLTNDHSGSALFVAPNLRPNDTETKCITVTYGGSLAANTRLYVASGDALPAPALSLASYLTLKVEEGTATGPGCAGFTSTAPDATFNGTLASFESGNTSFASSFGTWAPTGPAQSKTYRFTYTMQDDNNAQGLTASVKFTWEAQNS